MKLTTRIAMIIVAAFAVTITSCKTTEANYRAAYEAAKQKTEESRGIEGTIYEKIRNEVIDSRLIVEGDSIPMMTVNVKIAASTTTPDQCKTILRRGKPVQTDFQRKVTDEPSARKRLPRCICTGDRRTAILCGGDHHRRRSGSEKSVHKYPERQIGRAPSTLPVDTHSDKITCKITCFAT